jgi:hypothetical protein
LDFIWSVPLGDEKDFATGELLLSPLTAYQTAVSACAAKRALNFLGAQLHYYDMEELSTEEVAHG